LSGLANYLSGPSSGSSTEFEARLEALEKSTKWCDAHIQSWASKVGRRIKLRDHMVNVPFQIILINGKCFQEVVVSFAGREVLEREQKYGVKGFFSSDPHVVETFNEIYQTYVESPERIPYVPLHTLGIVREHDRAGDHMVSSFGNGLVKNLRVSAGTFSPVIGNSSKFTVWLLEKVLTTGNPKVATNWRNSIRRILDVGAGTGVLALAAGAAIRKHGKRKDFKVVALDACPHAYELLAENCAGDPNIEVRQLKLRFDHSADTRKVRSSWFEDDGGKEVSIDGELSKFDLIIGDLPFIHAEKQKDSDARFVDLNHQLHQALMWMCSKTSLLADNGLLLTSFSSLGGPEDITDFERSIRENSLQVIQRVDFYESGYMWMVYVLMKQSDYTKYGDRLWWQLLEAEQK
jgi:SAM-dependent methyltransferase